MRQKDLIMNKIMGVSKERAKEIKAMVREELARADEAKKENEKISRAILARQEFVAGGVTAEKLYALSRKLDNLVCPIMMAGAEDLGLAARDIQLSIEDLGKSIDPKCMR